MKSLFIAIALLFSCCVVGQSNVTIIVNDVNHAYGTANDGFCALGEALAEIQQITPGECVNGLINPQTSFRIIMPEAATYHLDQQPVHLEEYGSTAFWLENRDVTIVGNNTRIVRDLDTPFRMFTFLFSKVTLQNLVIESGEVASEQEFHGSGAALLAHATELTLTDSQLMHNQASQWGGALHLSSNTTPPSDFLQRWECALRTEKSLFKNNTATSGGAIYADACTIEITQSSLLENSAEHSGTAITLGKTLEDSTISHSTIHSNVSTSLQRSAGIFLQPQSRLQLQFVTLTENGNHNIFSKSPYLSLFGSIIASNSSNEADCSVTQPLAELRHTLIADGSCGAEFATRITGEPELSAPEGEFGLRTPLYDVSAPAFALNPVLDAVPCSSEDEIRPRFDQTGDAKRPYHVHQSQRGYGCDLGAVEYWEMMPIEVDLPVSLDVVENDQCSLIEALMNANNQADHSDCRDGNEGGRDVIMINAEVDLGESGLDLLYATGANQIPPQEPLTMIGAHFTRTQCEWGPGFGFPTIPPCFYDRHPPLFYVHSTQASIFYDTYMAAPGPGSIVVTPGASAKFLDMEYQDLYSTHPIIVAENAHVLIADTNLTNLFPTFRDQRPNAEPYAIDPEVDLKWLNGRLVHATNSVVTMLRNGYTSNLYIPTGDPIPEHTKHTIYAANSSLIFEENELYQYFGDGALHIIGASGKSQVLALGNRGHRFSKQFNSSNLERNSLVDNLSCQSEGCLIVAEPIIRVRSYSD